MYSRIVKPSSFRAVPRSAPVQNQVRTHSARVVARQSVVPSAWLVLGALCGTGLMVSTMFKEEAEATIVPAQTVPLNKYIDHTLLKADATPNDVKKLCAEAVQYEFASVCVNGLFAKLAFDTLKALNPNHSVKVCCVVGFPLGAMSSEMKAKEATHCIEQGATEIDMVIPVGMLKSGDYAYVLRDISAVITACKTKGALCKVIIETGLLTKEEKRVASSLALQAGADFIKTSTGFVPGGATVEDVAMMTSLARPLGKEVKASGGVRDRQAAVAMVEAGATRIGASAGVAICSSGVPQSPGGY